MEKKIPNECKPKGANPPVVGFSLVKLEAVSDAIFFDLRSPPRLRSFPVSQQPSIDAVRSAGWWFDLPDWVSCRLSICLQVWQIFLFKVLFLRERKVLKYKLL